MGDECECGHSYIKGDPREEAAHGAIHDEYLRGPRVVELSALQPTEVVLGYPLRVVDDSIPLVVRRALAVTARVAQRSMPDYPTGYDGTITEDQQILFILADAERAIGLAITALDWCSWRISWHPDGSPRLDDQVMDPQRRITVCRVWVAKEYRRGGLASGLVKSVATHFNLESGELGWELPLTPSGLELLRAIAGDRWWGRGDGFALMDTVDLPDSFEW